MSLSLCSSQSIFQCISEYLCLCLIVFVSVSICFCLCLSVSFSLRLSVSLSVCLSLVGFLLSCSSVCEYVYNMPRFLDMFLSCISFRLPYFSRPHTLLPPHPLPIHKTGVKLAPRAKRRQTNVRDMLVFVVAVLSTLGWPIIALRFIGIERLKLTWSNENLRIISGKWYWYWDIESNDSFRVVGV